MVMPLADLRAIYELLFRDGVIVAKKDMRPQSIHPDIKGVTNLKVIRAMGSLKSKGCVRETFAWKHAYYYITNKGTAYLREYLHLPPEIMPAPHQRVCRPASSARVHTVKGPTSYTPKPKPGRESQECTMDRHVYRHKRAGEERERSEMPPKNFRGSYQCDSSFGKPAVQTLAFFKRDKDFCRGEESLANQGDRKSSINKAKQPVSLAPSSSIVTKFSEEMPTANMSPCAPVKEVLQESECVEMQEATIKEPTDELIPIVTRGNTLDLALGVLREVVPDVEPGEHTVVDQQTVPLLAAFSEKGEQQDGNEEDFDLEEVVMTEDTVEKLPHDVQMMKQLNVAVFGPVTKMKTPKFDPEHDSATPPSTAADNFRDLTEEKVEDYGVDIKDTQKVMEKTIPMKTTSYRAAFEAGSPGPVVPSAALKTTLRQGDQGVLSEASEEEQDVQRVWPDFLEGLSLS